MSNQCYHLDCRESSKPEAQLLYVTRAISDNDWHSIEHSHYFAELFFVTGGSGCIQINNKKIPVLKNDLILINPNIPHTELGNPDSSWEYTALGIEGVQFLQPQKETPCDYSIHSLGSDRPELIWYLKTLVEEVTARKQGFESACQNLLELILLSVSRSTRHDFLAAPRQKTTKECRLVEQYINENFSRDITLEALSSLVHINKYYLVHAFKNYKGVSPINYLLQRRLEEARHLLESTNYPVTKIAEIIGFSSQSYFSQTFRRMTGTSPNAYRKQKRP